MSKPKVDSGKRCKDCPSTGVRRPTPHPGPRCATHHREVTKARSAARKAVYVEKTYSITEEQYQAIYEAQGGVCYICHRATGKVRRLAVDHDHACCSGPISCGRCVRGLLCKPCNVMLGHQRDDVAAFQRAVDYLRNPPARRVLGLG